MKLLLITGIVVGSLCLPVQAQQDAATRAEQYYRHGLSAVKRGSAADARRAFEAALRLNPGHANARYQLLQLRGSDSRLGAKSRELKFGQVVVPHVQLEDVSLQELLDWLDAVVRKETAEKFSPNFVIQDSTGKLAGAKVTIQLRNVPAPVVLKYALQQAGGAVRYDEHAILIRPVAPVTEVASKPKPEPGGGAPDDPFAERQ